MPFSQRALRRISGAFVPSMALVLRHCIWRLCESIMGEYGDGSGNEEDVPLWVAL